MFSQFAALSESLKYYKVQICTNTGFVISNSYIDSQHFKDILKVFI